MFSITCVQLNIQKLYCLLSSQNALYFINLKYFLSVSPNDHNSFTMDFSEELFHLALLYVALFLIIWIFISLSV